MSSSLSTDASMNAMIKRTMMEKILQQYNFPFTELEKDPGYVYDIIITDSSGDKTRILEGQATITPSVSRT